MVMENPGWYTPYTPYQAEIAQGRLESLLNFQTMVADLTGMEVANASLLDESDGGRGGDDAAAPRPDQQAGHGRAESVPGERSLLPQTIDVLRSRAEPLDIDLHVGPMERMTFDARVFGVLLQYPDESGLVQDLRPFIDEAHEAGALVAVGTDLLALALITPPGEMGADVVFGNSQRFGVPLGYGGPHAGVFRHAQRVRASGARTHHRRLGGRARPQRPSGWRSPRANSTSAARRRRRTSAPLRRCWPTWRRCTPCITDRRVSRRLPAACTR